ncbi:MAG: hypothetical protein OEV01_13230 [Nitrospira sp.]|nr:hypothetical protein [Nitrospira sp.]MDH4304789.1 hypothetical protein [Nitrospira sp.]MDH5194225.1 hypothetical protein [Nitrospira sp.]
MNSMLTMITMRARVPRETLLMCMRNAQGLMSRACVAAALLMATFLSAEAVYASGEGQTKFKRIPTQYIAALGDPGATNGSGAQLWGLWPVDPGPRGVKLNRYQSLKEASGIAPARWKFDETDWWLEEHGLIMEQPTIPLPSGKYVVTGARKMTAVLTVHPADSHGDRRWELDHGATLYDVTHLACRSARYTPATTGGSCSPASAKQSAFPVAPGGAMPPVEGCTKQDYAVLIVIGMGTEN